MIINHNISAQFSNRTLGVIQGEAAKTTARITTGQKAAGPGDYSIKLGMAHKIRSLNRASANIQDGISFIQTAEGYLQETQDILHRLRELAVQSANGIYADEDRQQIQVEIEQLVDEIDRIASHAQFNGINMLTGRFARPSDDNTPPDSMFLHTGADMDQRERLYIGDMTAAGLGMRNPDTLNLKTPENANTAIGVCDTALEIISKQRADLGAYQNRFEHAVRGIDLGGENLTAAESRALDADIAHESVKAHEEQARASAGQTMLSQAIQRPQSILELLE
jgi:flagellin